jgi:Protein of unknown function (DUF2380)
MSPARQSSDPSRRVWLGALAAAWGSVAGWAVATPLPRLYVTDFEVLEDHPLPQWGEALRQRALAGSGLLRQLLAETGRYEVMATAPPAARAAEATLRERHAVLHACQGCAQEIGRAAGAELVLMPWAQVVSQLIVNLNVELRDVESDRVLRVRSVDLRGNTDVSWQRGIRFLVRGWSQGR